MREEGRCEGEGEEDQRLTNALFLTLTEREQPTFHIKLPADLLVSPSLTYRMQKYLSTISSGVYSSSSK